jgi:hypothetical protein
VIFHRRRVYVHDGFTNTEPSHDLAHVLIGMGSSLLWCPRGSDDEVRISEFNAVFLEHLLSTAYECVMCRSISLQEILPKALRHARWFVQEHYAPFPMATEEAAAARPHRTSRVAGTRRAESRFRRCVRSLH